MSEHRMAEHPDPEVLSFRRFIREYLNGEKPGFVAPPEPESPFKLRECPRCGRAAFWDTTDDPPTVLCPWEGNFTFEAPKPVLIKTRSSSGY